MPQNLIILGKSNPVVMEFTFTGDFAASGLNSFTDIKLTVGGETYTTLLDVTELYIMSATELRLDVGLVTALTAGCYTPSIDGYVGAKVYELTGSCKPILGTIKVC